MFVYTQFVELHVLYVPDDQWDMKLNKVPAEAIERFISAGFIRCVLDYCMHRYCRFWTVYSHGSLCFTLCHVSVASISFSSYQSLSWRHPENSEGGTSSSSWCREKHGQILLPEMCWSQFGFGRSSRSFVRLPPFFLCIASSLSAWDGRDTQYRWFD